MDTDKEKKIPLEEVLVELALAQGKPDATLVDEYARRFPEYAEALTSYAIELAIATAIEEHAQVTPTVDTSALAMRAMSRFQNGRFEAKKRSGTEAASANPFESLPTKDLRRMIARLGINDVFMMKLRDRQIREDTFSERFLTSLAHELSISDDALRSHLAAPAYIHHATSFKADRKPQAPAKETFDEAVESSGLTPEQQAALKQR